MNRALAMRQATRVALLLLVSGSVTAGEAYAQQTIGGCTVLPANNIWNTPVDTLPVLSNSASMVTTIGASRGFHADFGAGVWDGGPIGIPFVTVPGTQAKYPATFTYADESDPGPYAVPLNAPIEGGRTPPATGTRLRSIPPTACCTSCITRFRSPPAGAPMRERSTTSGRMRCGHRRGPPLMQPVCRSFQG